MAMLLILVMLEFNYYLGRSQCVVVADSSYMLTMAAPSPSAKYNSVIV